MLYGLGIGQVHEVREFLSQIYRQQPSLNKSANNILVLLIWSSITSDVPQALSEWAASDNGLNLRRRLLKDIQESQTTEQLALTLAAWLSLQRLFPYSSNATQSIKGCFLADFDALLTGELLNNECTVLEHMMFSFSQSLGVFGDDYPDTRELLETVLDTESPALEHPDGISIQYWIYRTKKTLAHKDALPWTRWLRRCIFQNSKSFWAAVSAVVLSARYDLTTRIPHSQLKLPAVSAANFFFLLFCTWSLLLLCVLTSIPLSQLLRFTRGMIRSVIILDSQLKLPAVFFDISSHPWLVKFFFFRPVENSLLYSNVYMYATVPINRIDGSCLPVLLYPS